MLIIILKKLKVTTKSKSFLLLLHHSFYQISTVIMPIQIETYVRQFAETRANTKNSKQPGPVDAFTAERFQNFFKSEIKKTKCTRVLTTTFIETVGPFINSFFMSGRGYEKKHHEDIKLRAQIIASEIASNSEINTIVMMDGHGRFVLALLQELLSLAKNPRSLFTGKRMNDFVFKIVDITQQVVEYHQQFFFTSAFVHSLEDVTKITPKQNELFYFNFCGISEVASSMKVWIDTFTTNSVFLSFSSARKAKAKEQYFLELFGGEIVALRSDFVTLRIHKKR